MCSSSTVLRILIKTLQNFTKSLSTLFVQDNKVDVKRLKRSKLNAHYKTMHPRPIENKITYRSINPSASASNKVFPKFNGSGIYIHYVYLPGLKSITEFDMSSRDSNVLSNKSIKMERNR